MKEELKAKILKVMKKYPVASVATIRDGKPWVRYMMTQPKDDLTIFTTSFAEARKVAQIRADKNVHLAYGFDPANWEQPYVNIVGTALILADVETKKACWDDALARFFKGPEDPNYVVLKITPSLIEYMGTGAMEPEVYPLTRN